MEHPRPHPFRRALRSLGAPAGVVAVLAAGLWSCDREPGANMAKMGADSAFVRVVIPVLEDQCEDCHFEGGPMYKKMPFDDLEVVAEQGDLLLVQLNGSGREQVKKWLQQLRLERARPPGASTRQP